MGAGSTTKRCGDRIRCRRADSRRRGHGKVARCTQVRYSFHPGASQDLADALGFYRQVASPSPRPGSLMSLNVLPRCLLRTLILALRSTTCDAFIRCAPSPIRSSTNRPVKQSAYWLCATNTAFQATGGAEIELAAQYLLANAAIWNAACSGT